MTDPRAPRARRTVLPLAKLLSTAVVVDVASSLGSLRTESRIYIIIEIVSICFRRYFRTCFATTDGISDLKRTVIRGRENRLYKCEICFFVAKLSGYQFVSSEGYESAISSSLWYLTVRFHWLKFRSKPVSSLRTGQGRTVVLANDVTRVARSHARLGLLPAYQSRSMGKMSGSTERGYRRCPDFHETPRST